MKSVAVSRRASLQAIVTTLEMASQQVMTNADRRTLQDSFRKCKFTGSPNRRVFAAVQGERWCVNLIK